MRRGGSVYRSNLFFCIILVAGVFGSFILQKVCITLGIRDLRIILFLNHTILFLLPAIIYIKVTKQSFKEVLKLKKLPLVDVLLVILLGFICVPLVNAFGIISSIFFENTLQVFMGSIATTPYIVLLLLIAVMPAITEEITLRGVVLSGYDEKSKLKAAIMGGILFGIFHLNAHQFLYTMVLGFVLVYVVRVTGSIFSSMIIHFIINGTSVTLQKISSLGSSIANSSEVEAMAQLSETESMYMFFGVAVFWIIISGILSTIILWKLEKRYNLRNNIGLREIREFRYTESKERIIDLPFVGTVIFYFVYMIIFR